MKLSLSLNSKVSQVIKKYKAELRAHSARTCCKTRIIDFDSYQLFNHTPLKLYSLWIMCICIWLLTLLVTKVKTYFLPMLSNTLWTWELVRLVEGLISCQRNISAFFYLWRSKHLKVKDMRSHHRALKSFSIPWERSLLNCINPSNGSDFISLFFSAIFLSNCSFKWLHAVQAFVKQMWRL